MIFLRHGTARVRSVGPPHRLTCGTCEETVAAKDRYCRACGRRFMFTVGDLRRWRSTVPMPPGVWEEREDRYRAAGDRA